nr:DNA adenine methylase [Methanococcoides seepicolus]
MRYPGGKNRIFKFVSNLFYENEMIGDSYAEPYAGGAGLALKLLFEGYVNHIYINDFDYSIYSFWKAIIEQTDRFCSWIENCDVSLETWHDCKEIQKNGSDDYFDLATSTFFLNRTNISGIIKGGVIGGVAQKGKYKIDARFNKNDLISRIKKISDYHSQISISNLDGIDFLEKFKANAQDTFIYLDPPYYNKGADLYMNFFQENDHATLSEYVKKLNNKWMISYDYQDCIIRLYENQKCLSYTLSQNTSNKMGTELLFFSDEVKFEESTVFLREPILLNNSVD